MRAVSVFALAAAAMLGAPGLASAQETQAAAPAEASAGAEGEQQVYDPWEAFNRDLFAVHEGIDKAVLEPVARGYRAVTPGFFRSGVSNFLFNLRSPVIFANDVLQAEPSRAATTFARFGVNTTIGILGLVDVAEHMGLERHNEDFGQTLGVWGVGPGPYLFIPVLGPTNIRDGVGDIVDIFIDPLTYAEFDGDDTFRATRVVLTGVSAREALLDTVQDVRENSVDPYVSFRTSYNLLRESSIANGEAGPLPNFDEAPESELTPPADAAAPTPAPADAPSASVQTGSAVNATH